MTCFKVSKVAGFALCADMVFALSSNATATNADVSSGKDCGIATNQNWIGDSMKGAKFTEQNGKKWLWKRPP